MMAYGSSVHETTDMTPNMMMYGRETITPLHLQHEIPSQFQETAKINCKNVFTIRMHLLEIR